MKTKLHDVYCIFCPNLHIYIEEKLEVKRENEGSDTFHQNKSKTVENHLRIYIKLYIFMKCLNVI